MALAEIQWRSASASGNSTELRFTCLMTVDNDAEAQAAAYNRWYAKAHPAPLAADGLSYHRRSLARKRRSR